MSTCYEEDNPRFQPAMRLITNITNSNPAIITTVNDHRYVNGTIIRFSIPKDVGMHQLNKMTGIVTVTGDKTFTVDIDTTKFDTFLIPVVPKWYENTCVLAIPVGELSSQLTASTQDTV